MEKGFTWKSNLKQGIELQKKKKWIQWKNSVPYFPLLTRSSRPEMLYKKSFSDKFY